jgi:hypothetical protein
MDLESQAYKEALGMAPLVNHEETRAKPVPKQPPPRLSWPLALCVGKGNFGGLRGSNDPEHRGAGLPSSPPHSLHLAWPRGMGCQDFGLFKVWLGTEYPNIVAVYVL